MDVSKTLLTIFVSLVCSSSCFGMMPGGFTQWKSIHNPAAGDAGNAGAALQLATSIRQAVENKVQEEFSTYEPVDFKTQVVAGTNFDIKIKVGDDEFIAIRVYRPLPYMNAAPSLSWVHKCEVTVENEPMNCDENY